MRLRLLAGIITAVFLFGPISVLALTSEGQNSVFVRSDRMIENVYAAAGGSLDLAATFNDDVLVAGGTVTISGPVRGDVLVAGGTVKITGDIGGSVRAAGGTLEINGKVGRNVLVFGGDVTIGKDAAITGETILGAGTVRIDGQLQKSLNAWGGLMVMNGTVVGDVNLHTQDDCGSDSCVVLGPQAKIDGNFTYWSAVEAEVQTGAVITGTTTRHPVELVLRDANLEKFFAAVRLWAIFSSLLVGIVIALFLPRSLRGVTETMVRRWSASLGFGILILFAAPVAMLFLMFTLVGIPIALILGAAYLIDLYVTQVFLGFYFGLVILRALRRGRPMAETRWGSLLTVVVGMMMFSLIFDFVLGPQMQGLPFMNFLVGILRFALTVWTFGALILYKFNVVKTQAQ